MHASYQCCGEDVGRNHTKECYESRGLAAEEERVQLHNNFSSRKDRRAAQRAQYVSALEELETNLEALLISGSGADGAKVRVSLGKIKGIRAQIGGRK